MPSIIEIESYTRKKIDTITEEKIEQENMIEFETHSVCEMYTVKF